jgi:hypothetical protein
MIKMCVGNERIGDSLLPFQIEGRGRRAGINKQRIIDQKRRKLVTGDLSSGTAQNVQFHERTNSMFLSSVKALDIEEQASASWITMLLPD